VCYGHCVFRIISTSFIAFPGSNEQTIVFVSCLGDCTGGCRGSPLGGRAGACYWTATGVWLLYNHGRRCSAHLQPRVCHKAWNTRRGAMLASMYWSTAARRSQQPRVFVCVCVCVFFFCASFWGVFFSDFASKAFVYSEEKGLKGVVRSRGGHERA
jgi:hypothetical protein